MAFTASVQAFEGPLDLMLHLIRENELDIFDLNMEVLTDQYLKYLNEMENLHLEIESEYLVELSMLIEYKSKMLLPHEEEKIDGEYEEDPKEALVRRLLEYQKFKEISGTLNEAYVERHQQFSKPLVDIENFKVDDDGELLDGNPNDLLKAMSRVLRRIQLSRPIDTKYTQKELSVDDRILQIKARLREFGDVFTFDNLCEDCTNLNEYIVTFLSLLVLAKDHVLYFSIDEDDDSVIWLKRGN